MSKIEVLKREIEILKEVKHPHIIELVDVYEDERYLHLVTELCTGGELFDRIIAKTQSSEGHFSEHDAAVLVRDILDAIKYCHEKGIVHRDLKPENFLFLTEADDAPVKIIDFGLSRHDDTDFGVMQTKVGTPYYVAPEVLKREYTNSCDIWSIGVITYILLCGYPPFYGDSDTQIFESVRVGKFDFPSPEWDDICDDAKEFVIELLMKDPRRRYVLRRRSTCGKYNMSLHTTLIVYTFRPSAAKALQHKWIKEQLGDGDDDHTNLRRSSISHRSVRTGVFTNYLAVKKLKKAALGCIASNLTQEEVGTLANIFNSMDKNPDGTISLEQLDEAIARGNFTENLLHDLRRLRTDLAITGEHHLDWRDFVASTMDMSLALREDNIRYAFEHLRHSEADYLTIDDLAEIFGGQAQAREVMSAVLDADKDGKVSFEDFSNALSEIMHTAEETEHLDDSSNPDIIA